jgi:hypothetical protein
MGILSTNFDATNFTGDYIFRIAQVLQKMSEYKQWNPIRMEILHTFHLISCTYGIILTNEVYVNETVQWVNCEVSNKTCGLSSLHLHESLKSYDLKIEVIGQF